MLHRIGCGIAYCPLGIERGICCDGIRGKEPLGLKTCFLIPTREGIALSGWVGGLCYLCSILLVCQVADCCCAVCLEGNSKGVSGVVQFQDKSTIGFDGACSNGVWMGGVLGETRIDLVHRVCSGIGCTTEIFSLMERVVVIVCILSVVLSLITGIGTPLGIEHHVLSWQDERVARKIGGSTTILFGIPIAESKVWFDQVAGIAGYRNGGTTFVQGSRSRKVTTLGPIGIIGEAEHGRIELTGKQNQH
ncbi:hypothetical protein SDC9_82861 [bioreactor metagenome]|uniref:Uncharacterized protein n=1 Tax=bioreactor metagenome TaxID=1076179 RepID=A0A644Z5X4_9ZZZZ